MSPVAPVMETRTYRAREVNHEVDQDFVMFHTGFAIVIDPGLVARDGRGGNAEPTRQTCLGMSRLS